MARKARNQKVIGGGLNGHPRQWEMEFRSRAVLNEPYIWAYWPELIKEGEILQPIVSQTNCVDFGPLVDFADV